MSLSHYLSIIIAITCALITRNNALPIYSELDSTKLVTLPDGLTMRAIDADALAQPIMQRAQDEVPSMDLPILSGNATETENGALFSPSADSELQFESVDQVGKSNVITMKAEPWPSDTQAVFQAAKAAIGLRPRSSTMNPFSKRYQVAARKLIADNGQDGIKAQHEEEVTPREEKPLVAQNPPVAHPLTSTQRLQVQQPQQRTSRAATRPTAVGNKNPPLPSTVRSQSHNTVRTTTTTTTAHSTLHTSAHSTTSSPKPTSTSAYTPGWCGIHVRQVFWNTCLGRNHHDCVRINHTITLYDHAQKQLSSANTTLTYDGAATFSLATRQLPFPVTFTQLGVADGINFPHKTPNMYNMWPVVMGYEGADGGLGKKSWRNDDESVCRFGMWEDVNANRDFDCGFSCPAPVARVPVPVPSKSSLQSKVPAQSKAPIQSKSSASSKAPAQSKSPVQSKAPSPTRSPSGKAG